MALQREFEFTSVLDVETRPTEPCLPSQDQSVAANNGFDLADSDNQTEPMEALHQVNAVIFDMDGTLHDTEIVFTTRSRRELPQSGSR